MICLRKLFRTLAHMLVAFTVCLVAFVLACIYRYREKPVRPAVLFGVTPIINIKYWSQALRQKGYTTCSFVYDVYAINSEHDFDLMPARVFPRLARRHGIRRAFRLTQNYLCFLWALINYDVFMFDFDGGFLRSTPLQFVEFPLYSIARKKIVAVPYGSDVMDLRLCRDRITGVVLLKNYPCLGRNAPNIARRVRHYARWSSFIMCTGIMMDFLPHYDMLVTSYLAINTDYWRPIEEDTCERRGRDQPLRILHAPNHRHVKGTDFLIRACEELRAEGLPLELIIKERVPNDEIRETMRSVDLVASAFIMGYYELFAIEGMSMGKPVLNYWRPDLKMIYSTYSYAQECPIVDTPIEEIKAKIRMLANDPELCLHLGRAGRRYVEKYHSYDAIGALFDSVVREVWGRRKEECHGRKE